MESEGFMGIFFEDVYCKECGKKTKFLSRMTLADGNALCSECKEIIPSYMTDSVRNNYSYDDYLVLKEYLEYSNKVLRSQFHETHKYYNIHLDTANRLMYIDSFFDTDPVYFHLYNVKDLTFVFSAEEFKEGMINDKVMGKVLMNIRMGTPAFYYEKIVDKNAHSKAKKEFFGTKVKYENPKGMDEFMLYFNTARSVDIEAECDRILEEEFEEEYAEDDLIEASSELQQAMSLFMVDDLSAITLEELKAQRNRLIKTFHPDTASDADTKYAQKINAAYEVLKKYVE